MTNEKYIKDLKLIDFVKKLWYFIINERKNRDTEVKYMLNEKICKKREELNKSIEEKRDYSEIYKISVELDQLIVEYYGIK